jgi:hypothetical protein
MAVRYYLTGTSEANGVHTADIEQQLNTTQGGSGTATASIAAEADELAMAFTTASGVPNISDHVSGTWTLSASVNVSTGADLTYGPVTMGGASGHLAIINTTGPSDRETFQPGSSQTGSGTKTWSGSWDPGAGAAADLLEVLIAVTNAHMHNAENLVIDTGHNDSYLDQPEAVTEELFGNHMKSIPSHGQSHISGRFS